MSLGLVVNILALLAGAALALAVASDSVSTLVTTRRRGGRWWPTHVFYRWTWRVWLAAARRIDHERSREQFLAIYGPLSLLGLLVVWVVLLMLGWGLIWWALRRQLPGIDGYLDAVYFAGVGFFTVGFGDIVPVGNLARLLSVAEAFVGVSTMALVIGYLPTLLSAYSRREVQLLTLDDLSEERTTSIGFIESYYAAGGEAALAAAFADWERWCAEVYDSHTAYPMLTLFRSRQPGQHWLTALGVVTDAAAISLAAVEGSQAGPAMRLYRRATRLLETTTVLPAVGRRLAAAEGRDPLGDGDAFQAGYRRLAARGVALRPVEQAWDDLRRLRAAYLPHLVAVAELFLIPREFRNPPRAGVIPAGPGPAPPRGRG